jgi:hypothetical protein
MPCKIPGVKLYSLCPKLLECFDWKINIKESVGIWKNAQLGSDLALNQLSKTELLIKRYDGLINI